MIDKIEEEHEGQEKEETEAGKAGEQGGGSWHEQFTSKMTFGQKAADTLARGMGSWAFIIIQTIFVACWVTLNVVAMALRWDAYPFILLNLLFSTQAAYAAPIIMMSQNRQSERDREQAHQDLVTDTRAKEEIETLQKTLARIEVDKLDKIMKFLESAAQA